MGHLGYFLRSANVTNVTMNTGVGYKPNYALSPQIYRLKPYWQYSPTIFRDRAFREVI